MEITLDDEQVRKHFVEALITNLGEEGRKKIIADALKHVMEKRKSKSPYSSQREELPSIVEEAFFNGVAVVAHTVIEDLIKNDADIRAQLEMIAKQAITEALKEPHMISGRMAYSIRQHLSGKRFEKDEDC